MNKWAPIGILVLGMVLFSSVFTVQESEQALVVQFGEIKGDAITSAGLHWKIPFVQNVRFFDKRILSWDGDEEQIPTKDKKYIWVDTTARWKIVDVRKFAESLRSEQQAKARLDSILDGITRDTISNHNLVEAVRNSNAIVDFVNQRSRSEKEDQSSPADVEKNVIEEEITGDIEKIAVGREQLSRQIAARATEELKRFGIELIDVQLRRIAYEKSVEEKVYNRMISERKRIAEKIRSIGKGEEAKIKGKLNQDLKKIESMAYRESKQIQGRAEAKSIGIYADAVKADPKFYDFFRSMQAYEKTLSTKGEFILSTDSPFLKYLHKSPR